MENKQVISVEVSPTTINLGYSRITFSYDEWDNLKIVWDSESSTEVLTFLVPKRVKTRKQKFKQWLKKII